jgi:cullin 2
MLDFSFINVFYSSFEKVRNKFEEHFVENHKDRLLSECSSMVEGERKRELANLYILLKPLPTHMSHLIQTLQDHIQKKGLESISNLCGDNVSHSIFMHAFFPMQHFDLQIHSQFVENVLGVHKKYRDLIKEVFKDDQVYVGALDKACTHVINHRVNPRIPSKSPEMVFAQFKFGLVDYPVLISSWLSIATLCCVKLPKEFLKMKLRKS